jgi:preprotein translocase subunit SecD
MWRRSIMSKFKKMIKNPRIIILAVLLIFSLIAISPQPGVESISIRNVISNSSANVAGMQNPSPSERLTSRERITSINREPVTNSDQFYRLVNDLSPGDVMSITTDRGLYKITARPITVQVAVPNETMEQVIQETILVNKTINGTLQEVEETINKTIIVPKVVEEVIGTQDIGIRVFDTPATNIKKGLDLTGGTRVLLEPEEEVSQEDMGFLIDNMKERLNVFGLSDLVIRESVDLEGNQFILVEIAGANEEEVKELLGKQGKFEARIGNESVFVGGQDITYVARSADRAGIDPQYGCQQSQEGGFVCRFRFAISLAPVAAQRQADITKDIPVTFDDGSSDGYLVEQLELYLDDSLMDSLNIAGDLKGRAVTEISISGSGIGATRQDAVTDALANMKRLQTILITGSLPVKLDIVQTNTLSPVLGEEFVRNTIMMGLFALLAVGLVIFIRYRKIAIIIPTTITMFSEVTLLLGLAALIGWNLDLAAIAGIIIAVGTGVDHQIVIADEILERKRKVQLTWLQKIKRAFYIIMAAYFTTVVAMLPLWFAGAGLLKGFALTTIFGITGGVFVTRPAFAAMLEILFSDKEN